MNELEMEQARLDGMAKAVQGGSKARNCNTANSHL